MKINVKHVAKLANLTLTSLEEEKFSKQLESILEHVEKLQKVNTDQVEPSSQATGLENVFREDLPEESLQVTKVLSNTKSKQNNLFKVKGILEE